MERVHKDAADYLFFGGLSSVALVVERSGLCGGGTAAHNHPHERQNSDSPVVRGMSESRFFIGSFHLKCLLIGW